MGGFMSKCIGKLTDEVFVGNTYTGADHSYLHGVEYRIGDVALDIHGNELDPADRRPLFIKESSAALYDRIMMQRLKNIRAGKPKEEQSKSTPSCSDTKCSHNVSGICDGADCQDGMS
jgi:hypothetical protein